MSLDQAQEDVRAFHVRFKQDHHRTPTPFGGRMVGTKHNRKSLKRFRQQLIQEECKELIDAIEGGKAHQIAHEACDLIYVVLGTLVVLGIRIGPIWNAVHNANMRKAYSHVHHKPIKPVGWVSASKSINALIRRQRRGQ